MHANNFKKGYNRLLQVNGYAGYHKTDATLVGCSPHTQRKFIEAKAVQPLGKTDRTEQTLNFIKKFYGSSPRAGCPYYAAT